MGKGNDRRTSDVRVGGKSWRAGTATYDKRRQYKIVVMGIGGVGKSALTMRFVHGCFYEKLNATIEDLYQKELLINSSEKVVVEILDTAGMEQFNNMTDLYIRNGDGFLIVFNMVDLSSLTHVIKLRDHIVRVKDPSSNGSYNGHSNVAILLVGNKRDLVTSNQQLHAATTLAHQCALPYMETSAKSAFNVDLAFTNLVQNIIINELATQASSSAHGNHASGGFAKIAASHFTNRRGSTRKCVIL